jgi:DNA-binding response OmpR family regulator
LLEPPGRVGFDYPPARGDYLEARRHCGYAALHVSVVLRCRACVEREAGMTRVLVIEDEPRLREVVARTLRAEGYDAATAADGADGYAEARSGDYDMIVLDVMLPTMSGLEISLRLHRQGIQTPILMLTARDTLEDRVAGLDSGADDYLVKPFAFEELLARLRALLRRRMNGGSTCVQVDDLTLDLVRHEVRRGTREVPLTAREFALLEYLMRHCGHTLSRDQIVSAVWPRDYEGGNNVVDTYIHYLRDKVDRPPANALIRTIRGVGYALGR